MLFHSRFNKDVVTPAALALHADTNAVAGEQLSELAAGEILATDKTAWNDSTTVEVRTLRRWHRGE